METRAVFIGLDLASGTDESDIVNVLLAGLNIADIFTDDHKMVLTLGGTQTFTADIVSRLTEFCGSRGWKVKFFEFPYPANLTLEEDEVIELKMAEFEADRIAAVEAFRPPTA